MKVKQSLKSTKYTFYGVYDDVCNVYIESTQHTRSTYTVHMLNVCNVYIEYICHVYRVYIECICSAHTFNVYAGKAISIRM